ncbi:hypothetical protein DEO72_LG10g1344 [Vigna unguiculata]|uniref:Uncharacterized protein n=1 Tax=Vigna unguiculata TaxID=3917 RepID=A0A4D6NA15_VIGUN|nr:hypothetical protein DEO72_LG10g1344 [Vigna unguiculata]
MYEIHKHSLALLMAQLSVEEEGEEQGVEGVGEEDENVEVEADEELVMVGGVKEVVDMDGAGEGEEEILVEADYEGDDDYEVSSLTDSGGEVMSEDELYDVRIEGEELEDELYDVRIEGHKLSGASGSSRTNPKLCQQKHISNKVNQLQPKFFLPTDSSTSAKSDFFKQSNSTNNKIHLQRKFVI